jgi:hypothetical protein
MTDTYTVERKIRIDAPPSAVYERIVDLHRSTTRTSSSAGRFKPHVVREPDHRTTAVLGRGGGSVRYRGAWDLRR